MAVFLFDVQNPLVAFLGHLQFADGFVPIRDPSQHENIPRPALDVAFPEHQSFINPVLGAASVPQTA